MSNPSLTGQYAAGSPTDNRGPALLGVTSTFTALSAVAVGLRLFVRLLILKSPGLDDASIVLSLALTIVAQISWGLSIRHGFGRRESFLSSEQIAGAIKWNLVATAVFYTSLIFSKISIALFFLRILGKARTKASLVFLYVLMAMAFIMGILGAGYASGQCQPISKDWDNRIPGKCHGNISVNIGNALAATMAFVDFALASFPITFLRHTKMELRRKIIIIGLMSCGFVAGFCSIARVVVADVLLTGGDFTYNQAPHTYLAMTEATVSIVLACIPTLLPLVRAAKSDWREHSTDRKRSTSTQHSRSWPSQQSRDRQTPTHEWELQSARPKRTARGKMEDVESELDLLPDPRTPV